ncbi:hypothetical protein PUR61_12345 [Streptomyces sp. BE20]|uniref:hypothetical protein n=1 Tax=Streptomyces sp. BE303 TaxID=3002528 RepID=UPI002E78691C|nr:hypothetical protein [Streptomyces sp. BE303]MED7948864.1 hypothetical protein [Streptomyces sp. BE303]MEE1822974.1 hypothetical protein [Streptomyces sp. BE20]
MMVCQLDEAPGNVAGTASKRGHDCMVVVPDRLAELLLKAADGTGRPLPGGPVPTDTGRGGATPTVPIPERG